MNLDCGRGFLVYIVELFPMQSQVESTFIWIFDPYFQSDVPNGLHEMQWN